MMPGFRDGGHEVAAGIEDAPRAVGETTALGVQMREGRHDDARAGAAHAVFGGDEADVSGLVPKPGIGQRLKLVNCLQVAGIGHPLEELDGREAAGDDPPARLPFDPDDRKTHAQPPRCASRYSLTTNRSATWPDSILSSGDRPPKECAAFGRFTHSSAAFLVGQ